jgi:hypothetical protein
MDPVLLLSLQYVAERPSIQTKKPTRRARATADTYQRVPGITACAIWREVHARGRHTQLFYIDSPSLTHELSFGSLFCKLERRTGNCARADFHLLRFCFYCSATNYTPTQSSLSLPRRLNIRKIYQQTARRCARYGNNQRK